MDVITHAPLDAVVGDDLIRSIAACGTVSVPTLTMMHDELGLLIAAGLTPVEALQAATAVPAKFFGLTDRGSIAPGRRADLVLVDGDPTHDIHATRAIQGVWAAGVRVR